MLKKEIMSDEELIYANEDFVECVVADIPVFTQHVGNLKTDISGHDFTAQTWKEDFCFVVEDKRLYVARIILALMSPVFERMFQADFKEKDQKEMELPGKRSADVEEFLKCIYPDVMEKVTIKNAFQIIALAEEYQVKSLKAKCEACFLNDVNETSSAENIFKMLNLATLYSINSVLEKCTNLAAKKSLEELGRASEKVPISHQTHCAIHINMIEGMKSEQHETNKKLDRLLVLYKYHHAWVKHSERLEYDDFVDWEGKSIYTKVEPYGNKSPRLCNLIYEHMYILCETLFKLTFAINRYNYLELVIGTDETFLQDTEIKLVGNVVLFNGMVGKENLCKKIEMEFKGYKRSFNVNIINVQNLRDGGYIYNGEINVECNFLALKKRVGFLEVTSRQIVCLGDDILS